MAPALPFLMRSMMYSSLRSEFQFWPPALMAAAVLMAEAAGGREHLLAIDVVRRGLGLRRRACGAAAVDCWASAAIDSHDQMMAGDATITNGIRIPVSVRGKGGRE